jgi:hypothetical protein
LISGSELLDLLKSVVDVRHDAARNVTRRDAVHFAVVVFHFQVLKVLPRDAVADDAFLLLESI